MTAIQLRPALSRKVRNYLSALAGAFLCSAVPAAETGKYVLLPEPSFMWFKHGQAIPGSRSTVLVPALTTSAGLRELSPDAFAALDVSWQVFSAEAGKTADTHLATLEPKVTKDAEGFPAVAVVENGSELTASTLFAPGFLARFKPLFGDRLVAAIPDRFTLYVFPRPLSTFREYGKIFTALYEDAIYPASLELFEIDSQGIRAIGTFTGDFHEQINPEKPEN